MKGSPKKRHGVPEVSPPARQPVSPTAASPSFDDAITANSPSFSAESNCSPPERETKWCSLLPSFSSLYILVADNGGGTSKTQPQEQPTTKYGYIMPPYLRPTKGGLSVAKSQDKHDVRGDGFFDGLLVGLRALTSDNRSWRVAHMNEWWPEDVQTLAAAHAPVY